MVTLHSHATRLGVLDIGSNTVHMLIVDAAPGARPEPEASTKSTIRLMQYLKDDGSIKKAGIEALLSAVEKAMKLAEEYEITQLLVLATSALREAPNGGKILRKIEEAIGDHLHCQIAERGSFGGAGVERDAACACGEFGEIPILAAAAHHIERSERATGEHLQIRDRMRIALGERKIHAAHELADSARNVLPAALTCAADFVDHRIGREQ